MSAPNLSFSPWSPSSGNETKLCATHSLRSAHNSFAGSKVSPGGHRMTHRAHSSANQEPWSARINPRRRVAPSFHYIKF